MKNINLDHTHDEEIATLFSKDYDAFRTKAIEFTAAYAKAI